MVLWLRGRRPNDATFLFLFRMYIYSLAVLATYLCVVTDAARSLLRSTVEEAAAAMSSKQCLAIG